MIVSTKGDVAVNNDVGNENDVLSTTGDVAVNSDVGNENHMQTSTVVESQPGTMSHYASPVSICW